MHLRGQFSNQACPVVKLLLLLAGEAPQDAFEAVEAFAVRPPGAEKVVLPKMRLGAIKAAVMSVLGEASGPLRVREIRALVEAKLKLEVSYQTVCSVLTTSLKIPASGVKKVGYGTYRVE